MTQRQKGNITFSFAEHNYLWRNASKLMLPIYSQRNYNRKQKHNISPIMSSSLLQGHLQEISNWTFYLIWGVDCSLYLILFCFPVLPSDFYSCLHWIWTCTTRSRDWTQNYYINKFMRKCFNPLGYCPMAKTCS